MILTGAADAGELGRQLQTRFNEDVKAHYSFMDREQGYLLLRSAGGEMAQAPLMTMSVYGVRTIRHQFMSHARLAVSELPVTNYSSVFEREASMSKGRILVVEDDFDISNMLRIYFTGQGFEVSVAPRGNDALVMTRQSLPHLIVLDIMLPDMDGYAVCKQLRTTTRTSHIPIIFLTQKDERSDKIAGLELGADDYITKPFDIEELKLRVTNAISRQERESQTDPRTGLPSGRLIEDHLRRIIRTQGWALLDCRLMHFERFKDVYGFITGDEVLRFTSLLLGEVVDEAGTANDFIGHPGGDNFVVITTAAAGPRIRDRLKARFNAEVATHYNFVDRERGYIVAKGQEGSEVQVPLMTMSIGLVTSETRQFSDIREITEMAADARRQDAVEA